MTSHGSTNQSGTSITAPNCNLYYQDPTLNATASANTDLMVIGNVESNLMPDQVIVSNVPVAAMKEALVYQSNWVAPLDGATVSGSQSYPKVIFDPEWLAQNANAGLTVNGNASLCAEGAFLTTDLTVASQTPQFTDDSGDSSLWTAQAYLLNTTELTFPDGSLLNQIPIESVKKVEAGKLVASALADYTTTAYAAKLPPTTIFTEAGNGSVLTAGGYTSNGVVGVGAEATNDYPLDMFKQADAAGKVKLATPNTTGPPTSTATASTRNAGYSQSEFVAGDAITIYVNYTLSKSKTLKLDDSSALAGGAAKYTILAADGQQHVITDGLKETSDTKTVMVAYQFVAV